MKTQGSLWMLRSLLMCALVASSAQAHPIVQSWQNRTGAIPGFSIAPKVTYFSTSKNYDLTSKISPLFNSISVSRYYVDVNLSYGFNEDVFVFGRLSALYTDVTGVGLVNQNLFGMGDQLLGVAYRAYQSPSGMSINLQAETSIPAYSNANSVINSAPYLGDGSMDITGGAFAEIPISLKPTYQFFLDAGVGFTYRSKGYSSSVPWNILLKREPVQSGLLYSFGARGNISMQTDHTLASIAALDQNRGAGGSFLIGAVNPSWVLGQASVGYQTSGHTQYLVSAAVPFTGSNAPDGFQVSFGVQFDFDSSVQPTKTKTNLIRPGTFKQYDLEAKVTGTNDQLYLLKIDRGSDHGVEKGQIFDIFVENQAVAKARVTHVKDEESALRVIEYYQEQSFDVDADAKRVVQDPTPRP